jgi:hypothetical protein
MFGKVFGKRGVDASQQKLAGLPPHPGPDRDGVSRVIPQEIFDGPQGKLLRELGMSPDDESNMVLTPERAQAKSDAAHESLERLVTHVNRQLTGGARVGRFSLIPWAVWQGVNAEFLMKACDFYPCDRWNTMLLPEDAKSAAILGLPQHPQAGDPGFDAQISNLISQMREEFSAEHNRIGAALLKGDMSALDGQEDRKHKRRADLAGLASYLGNHFFGAEAWTRHDALFGASLGWRKE